MIEVEQMDAQLERVAIEHAGKPLRALAELKIDASPIQNGQNGKLKGGLEPLEVVRPECA